MESEGVSTTQRPAHPVYRKAPSELSPLDEDRIVRLDPSRNCTFCGQSTATAKVVHIQDSQYEYACLDCGRLA